MQESLRMVGYFRKGSVPDKVLYKSTCCSEAAVFIDTVLTVSFLIGLGQHPTPVVWVGHGLGRRPIHSGVCYRFVVWPGPQVPASCMLAGPYVLGSAPLGACGAVPPGSVLVVPSECK